jgi:uncharacterized protein YndB with AHSA1/START domain
MKKTLRFSIAIAAPRQKVWRTMLAPDTYREWTAAFCEGSYYEGSWEQGRPIRFLDPQGNGMVAEIAEHRTFERISIRHLGMLKAGVADTDSPEVLAWAPAYENYDLRDEAGGTRVDVEMDITPEFEEMMQRMWPEALARLKAVSERNA